jgi:hypothetical protein
MTITKQPPSGSTLFDTILNQRSAFKPKVEEPAQPAFPTLIEPKLSKAPIASSDEVSKAVSKQSTPPVAIAQVATPNKRSLVPPPRKTADDNKKPSPYEYAGAKARKRAEWEMVGYRDALPPTELETQQNNLAVEEAKAQVKRVAAKKLLDQRSKLIIESLPTAIRPSGIVEGFPHIMNLIAASWHEPRAFVQTLDDLLIDDRGNRAGFPFAIIVELTDLREYYFSTVRPESRKLWDRL